MAAATELDHHSNQDFQSVYGLFFEYSDLKQNQKNQIRESFFGFSDLVLKRKRAKGINK